MNGNGWAVEAKQLTRRFGDFTAVDGISFQVRRGEIFGFLGANGAGKTTAIRMLCGLLAPSDGAAWVDGIPILTDPERVKLRIGYMSQKFSLYDDLFVLENLEFYGGIYGLSRRQIVQRSGETLDRLGLSDYARSMTGDLPLGFKQRLALGCAALHKPGVLFLDEPTSGVDPIARRHFWDMIYEFSEEGTTVFVTTHYMDEAEYCNRVSIMVDGHIAALDSPERLKAAQSAASMQDVFVNLVNR
ncbi:MAG: ATP-binding cassette domain-containing protein [bacterium]